MKKKNQKNESGEMFSSSEVMSLLENMNDGISVLAEQQQGLLERFDGLEGKFDRMQEDISEIKYELKRKVYYNEFEKLEKRVLRLEKAYK